MSSLEGLSAFNIAIPGFALGGNGVCLDGVGGKLLSYWLLLALGPGGQQEDFAVILSDNNDYLLLIGLIPGQK